MDIIYPRSNAKVFVPRELDGSLGKTVFEAAHRNAESTIYWHIDGEFKGVTKGNHQMAFHPGVGNHTLTLVDEKGEIIVQAFQVL
jgi:penicillin-binding protein 1C